MCLIRVRAKLCRSGPDLRIPAVDCKLLNGSVGRWPQNNFYL